MNEYNQLRESLISLFPTFENELMSRDDDDEFFNEQPSLHSIWMEFAPVAHSYLESASPRLLEKFGQLVNQEVAAGKTRENAVSTCFLEHASQIEVRKLIRPVLSTQAKQELR